MAEPDPYATHISVLMPLLRSICPERVLEFGAGLYSTPLYLRDPNLKRVLSVESDAQWRRKVAKACDDDRLTLRPTRKDIDPSKFDLIFIDDGLEASERIETIRFVLSQAHPPTVIHDADVPEYREAIEELATMHRTYPTNPDTAVVWK